MKKIFSPLLLIFTWPFKFLKKSKFDNFVSGLIFGAIFSLVVNILTVQVQEAIQRQRILEAIENEIASNYLRAGNLITQNSQEANKNIQNNFFYISQKYSSDIWTQSSEPLQYIAQLDQETQIKVVVYYSNLILNVNNFVDKANEILDKINDLCFSLETGERKENDTCMTLSNLAREAENMAAEQVIKYSEDLFKVFHPTQDRLNSKFLRFMMGNKSIRMLSGES